MLTPKVRFDFELKKKFPGEDFKLIIFFRTTYRQLC